MLKKTNKIIFEINIFYFLLFFRLKNNRNKLLKIKKGYYKYF